MKNDVLNKLIEISKENEFIDRRQMFNKFSTTDIEYLINNNYIISHIYENMQNFQLSRKMKRLIFIKHILNL
jgi:ribosomal protein L17